MRDLMATRPSQLSANRWQNHYQSRYHHHHHWYHGAWHHPWRPAARWNYWWNRYPVMTGFGVTSWTVNRTGWAFGYNNYYNPYCYDSVGTVIIDNSIYDYSQPIVMAPGEQTLAEDPTTAVPPEVSTTGLSDFDKARQAFYAGDYDGALQSIDAALKELPNDAVTHEFRALTMFALEKYQESAATLYAVLSIGPGWDWTTMSGLYPDVATYAKQLRALEAAMRDQPDDPAVRLVLAYQYLTAGHDDAAKEQLTELLKLTPKDPLAMQMLENLDPDAEIPDQAEQVPPPRPAQDIVESDLTGSWTAKREDRGFDMTLNDDGTFIWNYSEGVQSQQVQGVWEVDNDGILAMELNDEGTMLAQVLLKDGKLDFYMLGDTQGEPPLTFSRN
jgi:tetratricopeptide (TPR) repeat protein